MSKYSIFPPSANLWEDRSCSLHAEDPRSCPWCIDLNFKARGKKLLEAFVKSKELARSTGGLPLYNEASYFLPPLLCLYFLLCFICFCLSLPILPYISCWAWPAQPVTWILYEGNSKRPCTSEGRLMSGRSCFVLMYSEEQNRQSMTHVR